MGMGAAAHSHTRGGRRKRRAPMSEINVTPLVDVMLVLLIIFMVTAPLLVAGVAVDLPESRAETLDQNMEPVQLAIARDGSISIDDITIAESELAGRLEADRAILALERDDIAAFLDRLPAEAFEVLQHVANAARLVIGGRMMVAALVDELLVLGPDTPCVLGLFAGLHRRNQLVARFDDGVLGPALLPSAHEIAVRLRRWRGKEISVSK